MGLKGRSFYVFDTSEFNPRQFTFVLMHHIFIDRGYKALYKTVVQIKGVRLCAISKGDSKDLLSM